MKKTLIFSFCFSVMALFPVLASAQAKIGTVDVRKVFDNYYKTKQAVANLNDEKAEVEKQLKEFVDKFKKDEEDYKKILEKVSDPAISAAERDKSKDGAEAKLRELREQDQVIKQYDRNANTRITDKQDRLREKLLVEIKDIITVKAKLANFTLVIDAGAKAAPVVLYTNGENDLTDAVLSQLNATAPASILSPRPDEKK